MINNTPLSRCFYRFIKKTAYSDQCRHLLPAALPGNRNISLEKDLFPTLIGKDFFAFPQKTKFIDIGTPNSYKEAETFFMKNGRERLAQTAEEAREEHNRGEVRRGTVDDLMLQITQ